MKQTDYETAFCKALKLQVFIDCIPPLHLVRSWLNSSEANAAETLQTWCNTRVPYSWMTGIGVINAAAAIVDAAVEAGCVRPK